MTERIAVVTGAGSGIGRAVSLALCDDGFRVVLAGRRTEALEETASLTTNPNTPLVVPTDITQPNSVDALFHSTTDAFGRVDVLFNNAGTFGSQALLEDVSFDDWQDALATNVTGAFLCTQAAFKVMKAQSPRGGRIINNGSLSAHAPRPNAISYTATKHAITGLTKQSALDGRKYDIACGQIDIGNAAAGLANTDVAGSEAKMDVKAVGEAVVYMAKLPLDANVLFMTLMATKMPYIGRG